MCDALSNNPVLKGLESNLEQSGVDIGEASDLEEKKVVQDTYVEENSSDNDSEVQVPNEEVSNEVVSQ